MQSVGCEQTSLVLRPVEREDLAFLAKVYASSRVDLASLPLDKTQKTLFANQQFEAQHLHYQNHFPDADFDIVHVDHQPAGRLYVDRSIDPMCVIDITLLPEFRGKGIGTRLMNQIINEATFLSRHLRLCVRLDNPAADWYRKLGFQLIADDPVNLHLEKPPGPVF